MDRNFGKHNEDHSSNLESTPITSRVLPSKFSDYILYDEFGQYEEEAKSSTQSIRIEKSLLRVNPSPAAPKVYEISDISSYHMEDPE